MFYSIVIPVYNRPEELDDLLQSLSIQTYSQPFEVVVIDDGSQIKSDKVVGKFNDSLQITYLFKKNSGPGASRNYGMQKAKGDYFIILDSDCILPENYLEEVDLGLKINFTDAFGGLDTAHFSFSSIQKAINYSMTSFFTTGGLRGSDQVKNNFQPRSFNMGISRKAFEQTKGFSKQRFGEDIDLTFRLWDLGFKTQFIPEAFVYHKRRSTWKQFFNQTFNFGAARPVLSKMHPNTNKLTYWFPALFIIGLIVAILLSFNGNNSLLYFYMLYLGIIFIDSIKKNQCYGDVCFVAVKTGFYTVIATCIQFFGYGLGFLRSVFRLKILNKSVEATFPKMFS